MAVEDKIKTIVAEQLGVSALALHRGRVAATTFDGERVVIDPKTWS